MKRQSQSSKTMIRIVKDYTEAKFLTLKAPSAAYAVCQGKPRVLHMKHSDGRRRFTDFEVKECFFQNKMYTI